MSRLGWRPDLPDPRDLMFSVAGPVLRALPASVDLRPDCPPVYDQGEIGSCTANAIAGAVQFDRMKLGLSPDFVPSRLFVYYNERVIEGDPGYDAGAQLRDGIKSVNKLGVCPEPDWPYDATPAPYEGGPFPAGSKPATRPTDACYAEALKWRAVSYQRLSPTLAQLKGCLAQGFPFVFGFTVYDNWYNEQGPAPTVIPLPTDGAKAAGGHAVACVGYLDARQQFIIRNSWGPALGDRGYYYMPYAYVLGYASDFWVIRGMSA